MIAAVALLALLVGAGLVARRFTPLIRLPADELEARIDALLPQTQCGLCGFKGCRPYAGAITKGEADIDRCPPGGDAGVQKLARLLRINAKPVDTSRGKTKPAALAVIDESRCIGCTLCIQACPVDAIIGAAKQMHTILLRNCTGCELCIPPCPVDCIDMLPLAKVAH
jgi:Na+-translocating ferredoxin:NAD+ oxidoreductase subunit B